MHVSRFERIAEAESVIAVEDDGSKFVRMQLISKFLPMRSTARPSPEIGRAPPARDGVGATSEEVFCSHRAFSARYEVMVRMGRHLWTIGAVWPESAAP